ncbi:MAG: thioredoxin family protein [Phycisphaeraceae bacterium]|nr:thioredoxin family protein [Phycisphaeraceae bacterium]
MNTRFRFAAAVLLACQLPMTAAAQAPAQPTREPERTPDGKTIYPGPKGKKVAFPLDLYDESADGAAQIREGIERAKRDNRRVLVMWGENRCGFCSEMHDLLTWEDVRLRDMLNAEYVFVKIDIGKFEKHLALAESHGVHLVPRAADPRRGTPEIKAMGAPSMNIIDPASGRTVAVLAGNDALAKPMTMQRVYDEQKLLTFLADNRPDPVLATAALSETLAAAARADKVALVWFGEPGCAACAALGAWLDDAAVSPLLAGSFVVAKIDPQRMTNGRRVMDRVTGRNGLATPWIGIVGGDGKVAGPDASVESPLEPDRRGALRAMLFKHGKGIDPGALDAALARLREPETRP